VNLTFQASPPAGSQRVLRARRRLGPRSSRFTLQGPSTVSVLVQVPRGQSQLLVKTDPAPTSEADAIFVSLPRAEPRPERRLCRRSRSHPIRASERKPRFLLTFLAWSSGLSGGDRHLLDVAAQWREHVELAVLAPPESEAIVREFLGDVPLHALGAVGPRRAAAGPWLAAE
jgi:hypothetical protein